MIKLLKFFVVRCALISLLLSRLVLADVTLPRLISDGMILQRDSQVNIWGWADKDEDITVTFLDSLYKTAADQHGNWSITLPAMNAGGPFDMAITGKNKILLKKILFGEVWVCSGQSNMDLNMGRVAPLYEQEIANSTNPHIRRFFVSTRYDFKTPRRDLDSGFWESASPETISGFTATGYFFARALYDTYKVPIGLIHASVGGSPAEAWLSQTALKEFPQQWAEAIKFQDSSYVNSIIDGDRARSAAWYAELDEKDAGYAGQNSWFDRQTDISAWQSMRIPAYWKDGVPGFKNGVVWFRKDFDVPADVAGKPARLLLGRIVDADSVYINGTFVGTTSYQYPPRRYDVPAGLLQAGTNTIVVRVINNSGHGGFVPDKPYELTIDDLVIDLRGEWRYQLGAEMPPPAPHTFIRWKPMGLFNGMIAPLLRYTIKGVIWYQGESNTSNPSEYQKLFPALITDWRRQWQQGDFPFLYVQLANYMPATAEPSESNWAELREAQLKTLALPNTGMAVTIDIGEWNDIHPLNKKDVGTRLALAAQNIAYGETIVHSGPIFRSMHIDNNKIILSFDHVGSGLVAKGGGELQEFAIAGADQKFIRANATIDGNTVVVWQKKIKNPVAVRYAWADNPEGANLYNRDGLPASPFRTDSW